MCDTFLVTGGAGFVGSHIVGMLLREGHSVRVLDTSFVRPEDLYMGDVGDRLTIYQGDVRDPAIVPIAMDGVDYVSHQAAVPSVTRSLENPLHANSVNAEGTLNLLLAARDLKVKRFVYASSSSVYGKRETVPKSERLCPAPASPYAVSKYTGELYCQAFHDLYGLETVVLRYFNVYGPRQKWDSPYAAVIPKFLRAIRQPEQAKIHGDGLQTRDFTFASDVARANLLAFQRKRVAGTVMNIGTGVGTTILDLAETVSEVTGIDLDFAHDDERPSDVRFSVACIKRARRILGYEPEVALSDGIRQTLAWMDNEMGIAT